MAEEATAFDQTGSFELPNDFLVGLQLRVSSGLNVDAAKFYLKQLGVFASGCALVVGYDSIDGPVDVATAFIPRAGHVPGRPVALGGAAGTFYDVAGLAAVWSFESIDLQPPGYWTFGPAGGRLDADAIRPQLRGVSAIVVESNGVRSPPLVGDIVFVPLANMQITPSQAAGQDPELQFSAIDGAGLTADCVCSGDLANLPPIKRINEVRPTPEGDFFLFGTDCLTFEPAANGLKFVDVCAKPCCGCSELEAITRDLERLRQESVTVSDFVNVLSGRAETFFSSILGSKISDNSCVTCA